MEMHRPDIAQWIAFPFLVIFSNTSVGAIVRHTVSVAPHPPMDRALLDR